MYIYYFHPFATDTSVCVTVLADLTITGEQKHLFSRHGRSKVTSGHLETCTFTMLHVQGRLMRVDPPVPVRRSLLRGSTATSRALPGCLRSARLWREKEPLLEPIPSIKTSWWTSAAQPGWDGSRRCWCQQVRVTTGGCFVCAFISFKEKV